MRSIPISALWSSLTRQEQPERLASQQGVCFDALYQHYYPAIYAQDTAGPWLFRIARSCATDYFRSISAIGTAPFWNGTRQALHASTSLDQINGVSIASLARPHAGLKPLPLLPTTGPFTLQASTYGVLTDASDANSMTAFVAGYRINGHDVLLYEQPSDVAFLSSTAQTVRIGMREGQLFQDDAGNHALQWYQNAMMCQLTSKLPVALLLEIASGFQPIKSWDLIR